MTHESIRFPPEEVTNCDLLARLKFTRSLPFAFTERGWTD